MPLPTLYPTTARPLSYQPLSYQPWGPALAPPIPTYHTSPSSSTSTTRPLSYHSPQTALGAGSTPTYPYLSH